MKEPRKPGSEGPAPGKPGSLVARPGYEVGYAKPPEGSKFRKGVSGNPRGRPKGSKNKLPALHEERMKAIILEEAYRRCCQKNLPCDRAGRSTSLAG